MARERSKGPGRSGATPGEPSGETSGELQLGTRMVRPTGWVMGKRGSMKGLRFLQACTRGYLAFGRRPLGTRGAARSVSMEKAAAFGPVPLSSSQGRPGAVPGGGRGASTGSPEHDLGGEF